MASMFREALAARGLGQWQFVATPDGTVEAVRRGASNSGVASP